MRNQLRQVIALIIAGTPLMIHAEESEWMQSAISSLKNNQPDQAIAILEPKMEEHAGELQYDFLLGQAALANQQANLAVFALERAILTYPKQDGARYTLARAYTQLGEYKQAKKELTYIVKNTESTRYKELSKDLLGKLHSPGKSNYDFIVKGGIGSDSNANSATENNSFLGINLSENSKAKASSTAMGQMQAKFTHRFSNKLSINAAADFFKQDFENAKFVNTTATTLNTGLNLKSANHTQEKLHFYTRRTEVDKKENSTQLGTQFTHRHTLDKANSVSASLRAGRTNYADSYSIKSINQLNSGIQHQFITKTQQKDLVITTFSAIAGKDLPLESSSPYGRTYTGAQAGVFIRNSHGKVNISANVNYINSDYDTHFFGKARNENNIGAQFKLDVNLSPKWTLSPGISYARSQSSIDLYDYERTQLNFVVSHHII